MSESADPNYQSARMLLLPALNEMIDIITTRTAAIQTHPPFLIWCMLFAIALACAGLTRYRAGLTGRPGLFYHVLMALITASILYVILDMEYSRFGLIRLDAKNSVFVDMAESMK